MAEKTVAIVGAGISGLSAGCYGRMNGYRTVVLEMHHLPGGLCTAWKRKGYTFDGCIHWLTSSAPGDSLYRVWEELGAVQGRRMVDHDVFWRVVGADGRIFSLYADPARLLQHMKDLSPDDAEPAAELCRWVRAFMRFEMMMDKPRELMSGLDVLKLVVRMGGRLKDLRILASTSMGEFSKRFKDPLLAAGMRLSVGESTPLIGLVMTLAPMSRRAAGFPVGGSLAFAQAIERRYKALGGEIRYGAKVVQILESSGKAVGVRLEDGTEIRADYVVSAADLRETLTTLLDGRRQDETHRVLLETGSLYPSCVQVSFGVRRVFHELDECLGEAFELDAPLRLGGEDVDWMTVRSYALDPSLASPGCSVITSVLDGNWEYWNGLRADLAAYAAEKERIAAACAAAIDRRYPGFKDAIDVTDVATPVTFARYTGSWKGTFMTWQLTREFERRYGYVRKTIPGLDNLYLASMWTLPPGGLPGAAQAGRHVVQLLCARDGKRFVTDRPSP
ncbi:MAG: NAD(P)/FAD-dependent oxidoreductase [Candidatus Bipolaricaulota bacterium]